MNKMLKRMEKKLPNWYFHGGVKFRQLPQNNTKKSSLKGF
jgi:hypothetical protein